MTITVTFRFWLHTVCIGLAVTSLVTPVGSPVFNWCSLAANLACWLPLSSRYLRFE